MREVKINGVIHLPVLNIVSLLATVLRRPKRGMPGVL
jgi:hypothetical protein